MNVFQNVLAGNDQQRSHELGLQIPAQIGVQYNEFEHEGQKLNVVVALTLDNLFLELSDDALDDFRVVFEEPLRLDDHLSLAVVFEALLEAVGEELERVLGEEVLGELEVVALEAFDYADWKGKHLFLLTFLEESAERFGQQLQCLSVHVLD